MCVPYLLTFFFTYYKLLDIMNCYFSQSKCTLSQMHSFISDDLKGVNVYSIDFFPNGDFDGFHLNFQHLLSSMHNYFLAYVIQESTDDYIKISIFTHVNSSFFFKRLYELVKLYKLVYIA